jgi:glycosyltransferase involved in cell wall biosynthesis
MLEADLSYHPRSSDAPGTAAPRAAVGAVTSSRRHRVPRTLVIFSQVFVPDPASVGQHVADVAVEMARRGWRVRVYAADRGYDDPTQRYARREDYHGVEVRRLPFASFGKKSILTRIVGTASFMLQAVFRGCLTGNLAGVFFSTSPPLIGFAATFVKVFRTVPIAYWAMDLNPDQLVAMGKLSKDQLATAFLESTNRMILKNSALVIALDRFMAERLRARVKMQDKLVIIPPWPHETFVEPVPRETNPFLQRHGLADKFVVMYSGNHSPSNPLDALLEAAKRMKDDPDVRFLFVGGGIGKKDVEKFIREHELTNCIALPYQPLNELRYSLSAADVHVVSLGENMVGIIHPCKVYGAMAVAKPVLFFGPKPSHISDLLDRHAFGVRVAHGDVDGAVRAIEQLKSMPRQQLDAMGQTAQRVLGQSLSQEMLCGRLCDGLEIVLGAATHAA